MAATDKSRDKTELPGSIAAALSTLQQTLGALCRGVTARREVRQPSAVPPSTALQALTAAAIALPGLVLPTACAAADDEARFGYGFYEEGERTLLDLDGSSMTYGQLKLQPIRVDNVNASAAVKLLDRIKFAFNYTEDTWSGATPIATAPLGAIKLGAKNGDPTLESGASRYITGSVQFDRQFNFYRTNSEGQQIKDNRATHMMSMASPEVRKQADFRLGYEWDEAALDVGGGISQEHDYFSHFVSGNVRWDLNRKLTTLNFSTSYTGSSIQADLSRGGALGYFNAIPYHDNGNYNNFTDPADNDFILHGQRRDWSARLGLTQVLSKNALLETGLGYTRSAGFLENPYKIVEFVFADPASPVDPTTGLQTAAVLGQLENRPEVRNQWIWNSRYVHYFGALGGASLNFGYRFFHDDWGIDAHTFDLAWGQPLGQGWTVTPRFRYYSQHAADFYQPYFVFRQGVPYDGRYRQDVSRLPIENWSSDHRLSGFGALSGGVTISKQFSKGLSVDVGAEYYTHQGGLKLGGGGEKSYADFDNILINAALKVDLEAALAPGSGGAGDMSNHADHAGHGIHPGHGGHGHAPAGVMFDHMISEAGGFMVGYRYMYGVQAGSMLRGAETKEDRIIAARGCGDIRCSIRPYEMSMNMHMLDLMYAPTDWLTLMLMPQFVDMRMHLRSLEGVPADTGGHHHGGGSSDPQHDTGGLGDTGMYALLKLFEIPGHHLHAALGISAPTGDVGVKIGGQTTGEVPTFIHYGMQLGSGTWDFRPSITYTGQWDRWSWGAQFNAAKRLENRNDSGFAFGDMLQTTAWGSYNVFDWLSASVRGVYTTQGAIKGVYNGPHDQGGPMDEPFNYGGSYWDIGFGLNAMVTGGELRGNRFAFEWLQPVQDDVRGYQLERDGSLSATWSLAF